MYSIAPFHCIPLQWTYSIALFEFVRLALQSDFHWICITWIFFKLNSSNEMHQNYLSNADMKFIWVTIVHIRMKFNSSSKKFKFLDTKRYTFFKNYFHFRTRPEYFGVKINMLITITFSRWKHLKNCSITHKGGTNHFFLVPRLRL